MRERPKILKILFLLLIAVALSVPIQIVLLFGDSFFDWGGIFSKLAPMNWIVMVTAVLHSALVYRGSRWMLMSGALFIVSVAWNNWLVGTADLNYNPWFANLATLVVILLHGTLLTKDVRTLIRNPGMRWWRTAPRKRVSVRALICPVLGGELPSNTFDLSTGGAFFSLTDAKWGSFHAPPFKNLEVGSRVSIMLMLGQLHVINCSAEVVRHSSSKGTYPSGFGIRFLNLDMEQKRILNHFLEHIPGQQLGAPL